MLELAMKATMPSDPQNMEQLLDRLCRARIEGGKVTIKALVDELGARSFGPLLLFAGLILASPLSGIPGMPTSMGLMVLLVTSQLLVRRDHFWLPRWLLNRSIRRGKLERGVSWLMPAARFVDRFSRPRLHVLVSGPSMYLMAAVCTIMALGVPALEVVPFSATLVGFAVALFGVALVAKDGVVALIGFVLSATAAASVLYTLL